MQISKRGRSGAFLVLLIAQHDHIHRIYRYLLSNCLGKYIFIFPGLQYRVFENYGFFATIYYHQHFLIAECTAESIQLLRIIGC